MTRFSGYGLQPALEAALLFEFRFVNSTLSDNITERPCPQLFVINNHRILKLIIIPFPGSLYGCCFRKTRVDQTQYK